MTQSMMVNTTGKVEMNTINGTLTYLYLFLLIGLIGFTTLIHAEKPPENILNNGDFDLNLERWHHWTHADAAALFQTEGKKAEPIVGKKVAYIKISKAGGALWHIQLYQQPFTLEKGTTYTYSLWAKSEKPRAVVMRILHQGDPWNEYARQTINLSEAWKEFFITFKMTADDVSTRAGIIMGGQKVDVWLDHLRLYEGEFVSDIEGAEPQAVEPTRKLTTTWATLKSL